jgi:hypothetical protein
MRTPKSQSEVYSEYSGNTLTDISMRTWFHFYRWFTIELAVGIVMPILMVVIDFRNGGGQLKSLSEYLYMPLGNVFFLFVGLLCARLSDLFAFVFRNRSQRTRPQLVLWAVMLSVVIVGTLAGGYLQAQAILHPGSHLNGLWWWLLGPYLLVSTLLISITIALLANVEKAGEPKTVHA